MKVGDLLLPNRILMAPLTRSRAASRGVPNALMARYYEQRASAGLIISEATVVTPEGIGYADTPGIWSAQQVEGWKHVTRVVHEAGGRIFVQLWHVGRISHPVFLNGATPVAPSAIAPKGNVSLIRPETPYVVPRALESREIPGVIDAFTAARCTRSKRVSTAWSFTPPMDISSTSSLQDGTNVRTDGYGGPIENRARLLLEVVDRLVSVWGAGRVGVHLAPRGDAHDMHDSNRLATFSYVATELGPPAHRVHLRTRASGRGSHRSAAESGIRRCVRCE